VTPVDPDPPWSDIKDNEGSALVRRVRTSVRTRVCISLVSLALSLITLEVGLRLAARSYLARTVTSVERIDYGDGNQRILCVGDSFTFGGLTRRDQTYPKYLERELRTRLPGTRLQVFNQGVCEYNTFQVRTFLPRWLELYQPDLVVLLVGSSNRYNPWGHEPAGGSALGRAARAVGRLRTVKLMRIIGVNLSAKLLAWRPAPPPGAAVGLDGRTVGENYFLAAEGWQASMSGIRSPQAEPVMDAWYLYNTQGVEPALERLDRAEAQGQLDDVMLVSRGFFLSHDMKLDRARETFDRAEAEFPDSELVRNQVAYFYYWAAETAVRLGEHGEAVSLLLDGIRTWPHDEYTYYALGKTFDLQSQYDADHVAAELRALLEAEPSLADSGNFMGQLERFENLETWQAEVRAWIAEDLDSMARMVDRQGAQLVVQNYPVDYPTPNGLLAAAAEEHALPLVDQRAAFEARIGVHGRDRYLLDDDHCTPEGHQLMAAQVARVIEPLVGR
jgi:lysophospholipase L1-like esterase